MIQPQDVVLALSNSGGDHRIGLAVVSDRIMARRISDKIDGQADCKSRD
jgi:D-arabinose 5-phosphate isomerase GutQ